MTDTQVLGGSGSLSVTITVEDSANGVTWAQLGSPTVLTPVDVGVYRIEVESPFGAWLRVKLEVDAVGLGTIGMVECAMLESDDGRRASKGDDAAGAQVLRGEQVI